MNHINNVFLSLLNLNVPDNFVTIFIFYYIKNLGLFQFFLGLTFKSFKCFTSECELLCLLLLCEFYFNFSFNNFIFVGTYLLFLSALLYKTCEI